MASKIIKPGTTQDLVIERFLFAENSAEEQLYPLQPHWPDVPPITIASQNKTPAQADAFDIKLDTAELEKTAYENGFRQGEIAGIEITERRIEAALKRYADSVFEIGRIRASLYAQVEREVTRLAIEVAKKIVHREILVDRDIIQTLVRVALTHGAEKSAVTVHVSPVDYSYLLEHRAELAQTEGRDISLLADKSIEQGGCLIETECGDIDARIEQQFREVEYAFFEDLR
jgi:flagellar assembly protein FliH